jgi:hypothetical protein
MSYRDLSRIDLIFYLDNVVFVPSSAIRVEPKERRNSNKNRRDYLIRPTMCSIKYLPDEILESGLKLMEPTWELRVGEDGEYYYMLKFPFVKTTYGTGSVKALEDLRIMAQEALWKVRKFRKSSAVNFGSRTPIVPGAEAEHYLYMSNGFINIAEGRSACA